MSSRKLDLTNIGLFCHKCGRNDFSRQDGVTKHEEKCTGLNHINRINISAKRPTFDNPLENDAARRIEDRLLRRALHSNCSEPISYSKKRGSITTRTTMRRSLVNHPPKKRR